MHPQLTQTTVLHVLLGMVLTFDYTSLHLPMVLAT